ncbi:MAG TPA: hypothetical protein VLA79_09855, partial [Polyangia bacterium]|nr:hypothetical protein [Polyangia bacterium]
QLVDMTSSFSEMGRRGDALSAIFDLSSSALESASKVRDITSAIGDLKDAAKGVKLSDALDTSDVHADKLLDAFDQLRPQIQAKITEAFETGGSEAAQSTADGYVAQIVAALGGKLSPDKVKELLGLGDLSTTLKVALDQSTAAKVKTELQTLTGLQGGETPFTASIALALDAGKISPAAAQALVQSALGAAGVNVPLDPVTDPTALAEAGAFMQSYIAGHPATLPVQGDTAGVQAAAAGAAADVAKTPATQPIDADTSKADAAAKGFVDKTESTKPSVTVDANTTAAIATMLYLKVLSLALQPVVTVSANIGPAIASAFQLVSIINSQRPSVPVDAYIRSLPSSGDIANRIGTVRVPIDAYVRTLPRINGDLGG